MKNIIIFNIKLLFYILFLLTLLTSCAKDEDRIAKVKEMFPNCKIYVPYDSGYMRFIVVDSTNVYQVESNNTLSPMVTNVTVLYKLQ